MIIEDIKAYEDGIRFLEEHPVAGQEEKTESVVNRLKEELEKLKQNYDYGIDNIREKTNWYFVHLFSKEWEEMKENSKKHHIEFEENENTFLVYMANEKELITWEYNLINGNRSRCTQDIQKLSAICQKIL